MADKALLDVVAYNTFDRSLSCAVQRALRARFGRLGAGLLTAGLMTSLASSATAAPFPPLLPLASLLPGAGGNGTVGFVLYGIDAYDVSSASLSTAGDVNGDGIDDLIIGASHAAPGGRLHAGESYVVFGRESVNPFPAVFPLAQLLPAVGGDGSRGFVLSGIDPDDFSGG